MSSLEKDDASWHALVWARLIPASLLALLYMSNMVIDIAAAAQLYTTGEVWASGVSAALICLPIFIFCIYEIVVTSIKKTWSVNKAGLLMIQLLFCPLLVMLRFAERIFWIVESMSVKSATEKEIALQKSNEPRRIELYLFLRPILQGVPQSFLQMFLLIYVGKVEIRLIQVLSMLISITSFCVIAASYQRFESQEETVMPWIHKKEETFHEEEMKLNSKDTTAREEQQTLLKTQMSLQDVAKVSVDLTNNQDKLKASQTLPSKFRYANNIQDLETDTEQTEEDTKTNLTDEVQVHESNGSPPPPPIPPRHSRHSVAPARPPSRHIQNSEVDSIHSGDVSGTRISFLRHSYGESSTVSYNDNRRSSYHYLQASVSDSSNRSSAIKIISVPDFEAPPIPKKIDPLNVELPTRKKGKKFVDSDNPMSYFVILLKWFLFLGSRMIALGGLFALKYSSLVIMLVTLASLIAHIAIMFVIIMVNCDKKTKCWWKTFLVSFSSVFCLLEIGVKFEKYTRIMIIYWPLCFFENIVAAFISYRPDQVSDIFDWWLAYLFYTTISTYMLSVACMLFNTYVIIPKTYVIYDE